MIRGASMLSKLGTKAKSGNGKQKTWIHGPEALTQNFAVYQAKFLGVLNVQSSKGVEVVKEATKKLKLVHEINKSEAGHKGSKLPKVELWISVDMVKVIHSKTKVILHQRPLHRISYCADDHFKTKMFSFIAKNDATGDHECFVFITEREASELTLTVGQAFELAYQRYLLKRGAADLRRSREATAQKTSHQQNGSTALDAKEGGNSTAENLSQGLSQSDMTTNEDVLLEFGNSHATNRLGQTSASSDDLFEQYMVTVASRGLVGEDQAPTNTHSLALNSPPATHNAVSSSNPFHADRLSSGAPPTGSPQIPRPKPSGSHTPAPAFLPALPKPPSKKDIQKSSPMPRSKAGNAGTQSAPEPVVPSPAANNPFSPDSSQSDNLMGDLQMDFGNNVYVSKGDTFDPFG